MKAKFLKLNSEYEETLIAKNGRFKKEYLGQKGEVTKTTVSVPNNPSFVLYDIVFSDGTRFCVEPEQLRFYKG